MNLLRRFRYHLALVVFLPFMMDSYLHLLGLNGFLPPATGGLEGFRGFVSFLGSVIAGALTLVALLEKSE